MLFYLLFYIEKTLYAAKESRDYLILQKRHYCYF